MELYRRIDRYWQTIRYLRPAQVVSRLSLRTRATGRHLNPRTTRRWYAARAARANLTFASDPWHLRNSASLAQDRVSPEALASLKRDADDIARGTFVFLNDRRALGSPVDWAARSAPQLWRYHLHYFDYLVDLLVAGAASAGLALMTDWVERVPMAESTTRDAWHPYVVSVRIVNWMIFLAAAPPDVQPSSSLIDSLRVQTLFVRRNLETDVGGNHLLKNLKALAITGCFWQGDGAERLRARFTTGFVRALHGQLRSDGGHYEQSPMYHAQVLGDAIELAMALQHTGSVDPDLLTLIRRMEDFLVRVCHPDGQLAQFGDTAEGMTPAPDALLAAAGTLRGGDPDRRLAPRHAVLSCSMGQDGSSRADSGAGAGEETTGRPARTPAAWDPGASGFVTLATSDMRRFLIADAGPVCPDDLPAHAHSDLFGFEVSVDGTRLIVDSGVSEYASGPWRDYYRSTRAHSTVMVDGTEQSECWGSFRVARRARVIDARFEAGPEVRGFSAAHTGFDHLPGSVRHRRRILFVEERFWLVMDDVTGEGVHEWTTFLHLHPDVTLDERVDSAIVARREGVTLGVAWFGINRPRLVSADRDPLQGWYAPAFGKAVPSPTCVGAGSGPLPARFGWLLVPHVPAGEPFGVEGAAGDRFVVNVGRERYEIGVDAAGGIRAARVSDTTQEAADR